MGKKSVSATTTKNDIQIEVRVYSQYMSDIKPPDCDEYLFAYHVQITNQGKQAAQLLSRCWEITDGDNCVRNVTGDGVVGEQPLISPGAVYGYNSYVDMPTPIGTMSGSYTMRSENGETFEVKIPLFSLNVPNTLN